jgi:hypothetical protein
MVAVFRIGHFKQECCQRLHIAVSVDVVLAGERWNPES